MHHRKQPFSPSEFKQIYSQVPRLTVEIILRLNGGVVLAQRKEQSWQGQWHIPGGTVLYQETIAAALTRIAQEELDISVEPVQLLGYIEYPSEVAERGFGWSIGMAFLCQPTSAINEQLWEQNDIKVFYELPENVLMEQRKILDQVLL